MSSLHKYQDKNTKIIGIRPIYTPSKSIEQETNEDQIQNRLLMAKKELEEVQRQSKEMIHEAHKQIEQERVRLEKEKLLITNQAREQGYMDGFEEGKQESLQQYKALIKQAEEIISLSRLDYQKNIEQSEDTVLRLGIHAASKILHYKMNEEEVFIQFVKEVIKEAKNQTTIKIVTHPEHYEMVLDHKDELLTIVNGSAELYIYPDVDLEKGSCILETPFGKIDASIDSQLVELKDKLFNLN